MYNDEHNQYHINYRGSGSDPWEQPVQEMKPVKKNRTGLKITALALACALLGGGVGGGIVWAAGQTGNETTVNVSDRPATQVALKTVDGKTEMTDSELYAANVNSVVSINVTGVSGTNVFGQPVQTASAGSGFILTADGYIVTNYHVVSDASSVKVTLYDGSTYDAVIIGGDEEYDIAVIKVDGQDFQPVTLGDSDTLNVGDHVLAIGNPLGELTFSMSGGMVSSVNRAINVSGTPFNMIQTDTSINPGNSGGPLFNQYGEVVGIVSAKYSSYSSEAVEGLGFAIPMNDVFAMIQDIITNGYVTNKPYLAVTAGTMNAQMAQQTHLTEGVYIYSVEEGGAAANAGIQVGDVITKVGDTDIASMEDLTAVKKQYTAGDVTTFTIFRNGESVTVDVTWDAVPMEQQQAAAQPQQDTAQNEQPYSSDIFDLFDYYFNSRFGGQGGDNAA